jgi:hypothetical protein
MVQAFTKTFFANENCTDLEEGIQTCAVVEGYVLSAEPIPLIVECGLLGGSVPGRLWQLALITVLLLQ